MKRDHAAQSVRVATCPVECGASAEAETDRGGARAVDARAAEIVGVGARSVDRGADARTAQIAVGNECRAPRLAPIPRPSVAAFIADTKAT